MVHGGNSTSDSSPNCESILMSAPQWKAASLSLPTWKLRGRRGEYWMPACAQGWRHVKQPCCARADIPTGRCRERTGAVGAPTARSRRHPYTQAACLVGASGDHHPLLVGQPEAALELSAHRAVEWHGHFRLRRDCGELAHGSRKVPTSGREAEPRVARQRDPMLARERSELT
eukprot:scaffold17568_cov33-Tisochrysis_lutea.AAC.2